MLIRFAASNHRSIKGPVELSLVSVDDRPSVRHFERLPEGVLPIAAIYGPNASGKSNILDALSWVSYAVQDSFRTWDDFVPRDPFRFAGFIGSPSSYEIDFMLNGVRHLYSLSVNEKAILFEELVSYPERRPRQLFVRDGLDLHFRRGLAGSVGMRELLTPTTLILSLARRFDQAELHGAARYISGFSLPFFSQDLPFHDPYGRMHQMPRVPFTDNSTAAIFLNAHGSKTKVRPRQAVEQASATADSARSLLKFADLGIDDVGIIETRELDGSGENRLELRLVHRSNEEAALFRLNEESDGTQMWFNLIGPVLAALRDGVPLFLDEIDTSLHSALSARLLDLFRDPDINTNNAQLIFTTHDTTLLGDLNRDEVWLTEKRADGSTKLTALAEFGGDRVRKSVNLERAYLQGRFGAVPQLSESVLKTLMPPIEGRNRPPVTRPDTSTPASKPAIESEETANGEP